MKNDMPVEKPAARPAFSLIELVVVIAILAVLVGILVPVLAMGRGAAARTRCMVNLRELGVGLREYVRLENDGLLPLVHGYPDQMAEPGDFTDVLPLIARHLDVPEPVSTGHKRYAPADPFVCPADDEIGPTWGLSYSYFPGAVMIDYAGTGDLAEWLVVPVTRSYERGDHTTLLADIKPWHDHPNDGRQAVFWDGHVGWINTGD